MNFLRGDELTPSTTMALMPSKTKLKCSTKATCATYQMESSARAMLAVGDNLVAAGTPHVAVDAYTTAIRMFEGRVCPGTIGWLRLHRSWCFKSMGMDVFTQQDFRTMFAPWSRLKKTAKSRPKLAEKASRFLQRVLNGGKACVCGENCQGLAKCGHQQHTPLNPTATPFDKLFWSQRARVT